MVESFASGPYYDGLLPETCIKRVRSRKDVFDEEGSLVSRWYVQRRTDEVANEQRFRLVSFQF